ncbi:DUF29 domain-containing protein [Crocosphaera watsonii WH 8501]|uniref:DUF29 domain-containing protein n=1 Tax=Crocosphaera watsonii WH 8501 TaxID=165597 RepID=Q4BUV1_CROWT|nr:DUF29 domain-containing protein [Crocosphaera watsonii]EAM47679.1 Protein of unknown function DUF29 [Crocosphaera watsonii WH 8501]
MKTNLYDKDYCLWLEETIQVLREGRLTELDISNLIEEIEDMGISQKKAVKSNSRILLMHLLKWKYQPTKRSKSWKSSIIEHRKRIRDSFEDSPSLKVYFANNFDLCYQDARELAAAETGLSIDEFPIESPFFEQDTLKPDYFPE